MNLNFGEFLKRSATLGVALSLVIAAKSCLRTDAPKGPAPSPLIEISPLEQGRGQWKVAAAAEVTVAVTAPEAEGVRILVRPEGVEDDHLELERLSTPVDREKGIFVTRLNLAPDFAGAVWAEASYPDGAKRATETIALANVTADAGTDAPLDAVGGSVGTDESARSDKLTGGRIRKTNLIAGEPDVRITINAPAFLLTLWQNGREVSSYHIGIGSKDFPVPIGEREATAIIFNPHWVPPGGAWARRAGGLAPGEMIEPGDPRNPLGRIKIPLGEGYQIHEATNADDIGRAVSHGSIRMLGDDLFDLAKKIIRARNLPGANSQIKQARDSRERFVAPLGSPLLVDINYDLQVVEGGVLRLYPDVYARGSFALDSLRAELQGAQVAAPLLDDQTLQRVLNRVSDGAQFVINVADIRKGRWDAGRMLPLTEKPVENGREIAQGAVRGQNFGISQSASRATSTSSTMPMRMKSLKR